MKFENDTMYAFNSDNNTTLEEAITDGAVYQINQGFHSGYIPRICDDFETIRATCHMMLYKVNVTILYCYGGLIWNESEIKELEADGQTYI